MTSSDLEVNFWFWESRQCKTKTRQDKTRRQDKEKTRRQDKTRNCTTPTRQAAKTRQAKPRQDKPRQDKT